MVRYYSLHMDQEEFVRIIPEYEAEQIMNQPYICYAGEEDHHIVAYAVFCQVAKLNCVRLVCLYVDEDHRRNYVGRDFMKFCLKDLKDRKTVAIYASFILMRNDARRVGSFLEYMQFDKIAGTKQLLHYDEKIYKNKFMQVYEKNRRNFPVMDHFKEDYDARLPEMLQMNARHIEMYLSQSAIWRDTSCFLAQNQEVKAWELCSKRQACAVMISMDFSTDYKGDRRMTSFGMLGHYLKNCQNSDVKSNYFYCKNPEEKEMFKFLFGRPLNEYIFEEYILDLREDVR